MTRAGYRLLFATEATADGGPTALLARQVTPALVELLAADLTALGTLTSPWSPARPGRTAAR